MLLAVYTNLQKEKKTMVYIVVIIASIAKINTFHCPARILELALKSNRKMERIKYHERLYTVL